MLRDQFGCEGQHDMIAEAERLRALHELEILDTPREQQFDTIVERALGYLPRTSIAAISLIDADRLWFKAVAGWEGSEVPRSIAFCNYVVRTMEPIVVEDATKDIRFARNPLVTGPPELRFYAGVPLTGGLGTLCVFGAEPRHATQAEIAHLIRLAKFVDIHLTVHGAKTKLKRRA